MRRALSNLLSNALRYTAEGRQILVSVREHGTDAMIVVENEGEEIRPDLLPYIFDRFFGQISPGRDWIRTVSDWDCRSPRRSWLRMAEKLPRTVPAEKPVSP
jgi:hypothetical protein